MGILDYEEDLAVIELDEDKNKVQPCGIYIYIWFDTSDTFTLVHCVQAGHVWYGRNAARLLRHC